MRRVRRVGEETIISEFLKSEIQKPEHCAFLGGGSRIAFQPDLSNSRENTTRRKLLFLEKRHLWRELPGDIEWWEVAIEETDLGLLHVFPRHPWTRIPGSHLLLKDAAVQMRRLLPAAGGGKRVGKIGAIAHRLRKGDHLGSVLLIGVDSTSPITILDGNHRLSAALIVGDAAAHRQLRAFCGFSPAMHHCCWYSTTPSTLWQYAKHRVESFFDSELDLPDAISDAPNSAPPRLDVSAGHDLGK